MHLIAQLKERISREPSLFRAQLMREDITRLEKLAALARSTPDAEAYRRAGRRLSWTTLDARTVELGAVLDELLDAVRAVSLAQPDASDARAEQAWLALARLRMERLVGCLATPPLKPSD
jgi:hypothetical protein